MHYSDALKRFRHLYFLFLLLLSSCGTPIGTADQQSGNLPQAEVVFQVVLPGKIGDDEGLYLEILDEVTGIYFKSSRFSMTRNSDTAYIVRIPLTIGAVVNYRYIKVKESAEPEYNSRNQPVLSRKLIVNGPELVQDRICGWASQPCTSAIGKITGQVIDQSNNAPIPDLIISAAGLQTTSSSDGSFILEGVPEGTHNLVILSKDSSYAPFQQYATIAANATTPVFVNLQKREMVKVTFNVIYPDNFSPETPVKIAGNISQLGNPFSLLSAGTANRSDDLPALTKTGNKKYSITMDLPAGAYLKYKFTQGDGFWNSEVDGEGKFILREFIVPNKDTSVSAEISTIQSPGAGNISFEVTVDAAAQQVDSVYIQLNPYDWMEPIPMVKTEAGTWKLTLASPLQLVSSTSYRICRNGDCDKGLSTVADSSFSPSPETKLISIQIPGWQNYESMNEAPSIDSGGLPITINPNLITGVEISRNLPGSWVNSVDTGFGDIQNLGAKWVILSPSWSLSNAVPPMIEPISSSDLSWTETQKLINYAKSHDLQPVIFPRLSTATTPLDWETYADSGSWSTTFFERYKRFIINYADLSEIMGAEAIVLGDPSVYPFFQMQADGNVLWDKLISEVRARFSGKIIGILTLPSQNPTQNWLENVDMVYVLYSPSVSGTETMLNEVNSQLDALVYPVFEQYQKPILLGINVPSSDTALGGCVDINGSCVFQEDSLSATNLTNQSSLYNAVAAASFSKNWISGLISRGYDPFILVQDSDSSVYGKPAYNVLWFWYHLVLNLETQ